MVLEKFKTSWQGLKFKLQGKGKIPVQGKGTKQVPIDPDPGPRLKVPIDPDPGPRLTDKLSSPPKYPLK